MKFEGTCKGSVIQFSVLLFLVGVFFSVKDRIIEYIELEGTHKDHCIQLPAPRRTT